MQFKQQACMKPAAPLPVYPPAVTMLDYGYDYLLQNHLPFYSTS